jgi:hypothetical protein
MIRIRLGQRWKRERPPHPVDSFGLELDGIELLPSANEEPLLEVVPQLLQKVAALARAEAQDAQLSLTGAHLELLMERLGPEVLLEVVSLERPARLGAATRVELSELLEATGQAADAFLAQLEQAGGQRPRALGSSLRALKRPVEDVPAPGPAYAYSFRRFATAAGQLGFWLFDEGRGRRFTKGDAALPSLLLQGELVLPLSPTLTWRAEGLPYLFALELARQAEELAAAIDAGQEAWRFRPGGLGPELALDLRRHTAVIDGGGGGPAPLDPSRLVRGMFELGGELALAFRHLHPAQGRNPYLEALARRCQEGLSALREPTSAGDEPTVTSSRRIAPERPLPTPGQLKRLLFERAWETTVPEGANGALWLGASGPWVVTSEQATGLSRKGAIRVRRAGAHGVAVHPGGTVIAAEEERVLGFEGAAKGARWLHDHDGLPIGPWLLELGGVWLTASEDKGLVGFDALTGRERWRLMPPRTQRIHVSLLDGLAWMATDGGLLVGVEPLEGQARFRIRAPLPFVARPLRAGKRTYALLGRGEQGGVVALDSSTRQVDWTVELPLARAAFLAHGARVWVVGRTGQEVRVCCLTSSGKLLFQRQVPIGPPPFQLLAHRGGVIATDRNGGAVLLGADGQVGWRVGASGEPHAATLEPSFARGLLLLPGETVRLVDPAKGDVLGELPAGPGLTAARADGKLTLHLLDEDGRLCAHRLLTHLAVVRR